MRVPCKRSLALVCIVVASWNRVGIAQQVPVTKGTLRTAARLERRGRSVEALAIYQALHAQQPDQPAVSFAYASLLLQQRQQLETARALFARVQEQNPQFNPQLGYRLARTQHLVGQYAEASATYEAAMRGLRNTPSMDDLSEEDGPDIRSLDASHRFSASELILLCRKGVTECQAALAMKTERFQPIEVTPLGGAVNTAQAEYAPVVNENGRMLLFAARRGKKVPEPDKPLPHENIFYALQDDDGKWAEPHEVGRLNTALHEAPLSLSGDGRNLYLYRDVNGGDIFIAKRGTNGTWSAPTPVGKPVNSPYYEPSFCLSPNGRFAFFASDRPEGFGGLDLYVTMRQPDGSWSPAFNLGPSINTAHDEDAPFINAENSTLYFASRGHNSIGGFDLFRSYIDGAIWTDPINLGPGINTPFDETDLTLDANEQEGYFASNRPGVGGKDLYAVRFGKPLPPETDDQRPAPTAMLEAGNPPVNPTRNQGTITSAGVTSSDAAGVRFALSGRVLDGNSRQPVLTEVSVINRATRLAVAAAKTDPATGSFRILLPSDGSSYALEIQTSDYMFYTRNIDVASNLAAEANLADIPLTRLETGKTMVLNKISFENNKSIISRRSQPELARLYELLRRNPALRLEIGGHTDSRGGAAYNQKLSEQRARAVARYLNKLGVANTRLKAVGYGMRAPIASNDTEEGRQQNRRTELKVLEN